MDKYMPVKYWVEDNELHRAYFDREEDLYDSPRDWDNLGTMVCGHRRYNLGDIQVKTREEWFANKPLKADTLVLLPLGLLDHSGLAMYIGGVTDPWDSGEVGYIFVRKDNPEVVDYKKTHTWKETKEWAENILRSEVATYDAYLHGDVYYITEEKYDEETETWDNVDGYGGVYVVDDTYQKEWENAVSQIKEFSGNHELFDEDVANDAIEHHTIDILCGQKVFEFMES